MFCKIFSAGIWGIDGFLVMVEADIRDGLPGFTMTGNLSQETREASERVRTALKNAGFSFPAKKVTVNLAPADIRKDGAGYDLAIAAAVLGAYWLGQDGGKGKREREKDREEWERLWEDSLVVGEVGLDGRVKAVRGVLSLVLAAREKGIVRCFLPEENVLEGELVEGMEIIPVTSIGQFWEMIWESGEVRLEKNERICGRSMEKEEEYDVDFSELNGQALLRRATEIAAAGRHNLLYLGSAGTGKTMAAKRIPTIMPPLGREESLEISKIYSICGMLPPDMPLMTRRPFRSPHHTITASALAGGGGVPKPGEISLASGGVLFLDELPEFSGKVIEILRQPLEEKKVTISRVHGSYTFPANLMLVAAMNPCPCGYYPDHSRCRCSLHQVRRYIGKISRPILDRIDITVEASPVAYEEFRTKKKNESSEEIRKRVIKAQAIQQQRGMFNGEMSAKEVEQYCVLEDDEETYLQQIYQKMGLSARGCHKILKVARTIADLEGKEKMEKIHLSEAVGYRSLEEKYWN